MKTKSLKLKKILKIFLIIFAIIIIVFLGVFIYISAKISYYKKTIPLDENKLSAAYLKPKIYSDSGEDFSSFKFSSTAKFDEINENTKNAFISIEDKKFYSHNGVNFGRIAKAFLTNIKSGSLKEGGSTISQQLIKNAFLSSEKSVKRKLKEIALTEKLEEKYSKDQILEMYLNTIYFGNGFYGIENASQGYFNKSCSKLNLNDSATLAAIVKSPNFYTKESGESKLFERKNLVLSEMLKDGKISKNEFDETSIMPVSLAKNSTKTQNEAYQNAAISEASSVLGISEKQMLSSGFHVYTYFNENVQNKLASSFEKANAGYNFGGVVVDNSSGGVTALVSNLSNFSNLKRQAGSTIKPPLIYAPAIESGKYIPESYILDEKIDINGYSPKNASGNYLGFVTMNKAAEKSLNVPAVKIFEELGEENCKQIASRLGIDFSEKINTPSLALGSSSEGETLLNIVSAYTSFANEGMFKKAKFIKEIKDASGNVIYSNLEDEKAAINKETAYFITKMLKNVATNGTAKTLASLDFDVASKTGTVGVGERGLNSDAYNISYTSSSTFGVWIGSNDNEEKNLMPKSINGSTTPTKIMYSLLESVYKNTKPKNFAKPDEVKQLTIDALEYDENHSLLIAGENTPERYKKQIEAPSYFEINEISTRFQNEPNQNEASIKTDLSSQTFVFNFLAKQKKED